MPSRLCRCALALVGALLALGVGRASTPLSPAAIAQELRSFRTMGTVLHVGAHPDDENTQLITYLARGRGYRTAYLSLTRGDGGQNELGSDFDAKLGVARTQELLAARRLDGGRQFFSRAIDFGYSKTPEETLAFWDREQVLADVVRVIRRFRPDVIVTRFPVPPGSGGHGHHTASAILAVEAFKLAGDPHAFPEQIEEGLAPWQAKRIVWNVFGPGRGPNPLKGPTVQVDIGGNDPVSGEPFGTIANRSRGMHKTQGLGMFSGRSESGPNLQTFMVLAGEPASQDLMDGVDLTWDRVPGGAEIGRLADEAIASFDVAHPAASVPRLLALRARLATLEASPLVDDKRAQLDRLVQACLGLQVTTTVDQAEVVPGERIRLHTTLSVATDIVPVRRLALHSPGLILPSLEPAALTPGQPLVGDVTVVLPRSTPVSQPYWLRAAGAAGVFRVDDPRLIGDPENPPVLPLEHVLEVGGQTLVIADEPVPAGAATAAGGQHRLQSIPPVSIAFGSEVLLFTPGATHEVTIELSAARAAQSGNLRLEVPTGWQVTPAAQAFQLARAVDHARFSFTVTSPAAPSSGEVAAVAEVNGRTYSFERQEIRYSHIPWQLLQPPARIRVVSFDLAIRGRTVGYVAGAGDAVADCLAQLGYQVTPLAGADLTLEKLRGFDAVVLGVRAFNVRPELAGGLAALLAYAEQGGTVVVQYNRPNGLQDRPLGPFPLSIQGPAPQWRVTDERSPFTLLAPEHPALTTPNRIGPDDFAGWVQERGAYFPSSWDEAHYQPLISFNDPGEAPLRSGILVARTGRGYYVYTGLAFFRQLPAGVPGACRLFANLVSLGK